MDRATLQHHIEQAEDDAAAGRERVERQTEIVAGLESQGRDATLSRTLLDTLIQAQVTHEADVTRLRAELALKVRGERR